ncbi:MAG: hypothetical protein GXP04_09270 [Alphaproteobacteria bacterium]|nr:hypothetical protein [Alphaproteobacteria bacterium]
MDEISKFFENALVWLKAIPNALRDIISTFSDLVNALPLGYVGILPIVLVFVLYAVTRYIRRWRGKLSSNTVYNEHPTMVQGDIRSFLILLLLTFIPLIISSVIGYFILTNKIPFEVSNLQSQLVFSIPLIYTSTGLLGFVVWNGVSQAEEIIIEPEKIKVIHKIPVGEYAFYTLAFMLLKLLLNMALVNIGDWVKLPLKRWEQEIKLAGGGNIPITDDIEERHKSRTLTIFARSIDSIGEEEPWLLRFRNIGHLTVYRIGENPLELRYLPKFKQLKTVVLRLTSKENRRQKTSDGP